ncbi:hydroxyquinol 1,2-dioxygenase [Ramlibacter sp. AN1015]|uniref:hydroxyquinol 1,2-dioxygenase n=1 Tax=Ramlibacter sp. AN1015 TaxID=3133428 RepID=UPI0030BDAED2
MIVAYQTRFGSLASHEKGRVEPIADNVKHYAFSNCFDIASKSPPYQRVVFGQNQIYVMEVARAEGRSPWYTCAHDEFVLCMDGELEVHLIKLDASQQLADAEHNGAVLVEAPPRGEHMGWMVLRRGHQGLLPRNSAYQFRAASAAVAVIQTCKGPLSVEKWADICQTA